MSEDYRPINTPLNGSSFNKGTNAVNKRNDKGYLKDRLSKIVSVYVPNDDAEKVLLKFNDDAEMDIQEERGRSLLQSIDDGLSYEVELLCSLKSAIGRESVRVKCACVAGEKLLICLEGESQIYRLSVRDEGAVVCESVWLPKLLGLPLFPLELRAFRQYVYISGTVDSQSLIVKYDHEEQMVVCTKRYDHQKFGSFDIDEDGDLLLLSPQLEPAGFTAQISKLSESFQSRKYYINLGDEQAVYRPLSVAAHVPGGTTWVTMTKKSGGDSEEEEEHRLMCFNCCVDHYGGDKDKLRAALSSNRWRMAGFKLGALAVLGNYVLAIDKEQHNLCFISWNSSQGHPVVKKISAPGSPNLVHLCSDRSNEAFLFTEESIFLFKFHEQLIKDSEILV